LKLLTSIVLLSIFLGSSAQAKEPLLFIVNHPGSKPYLYFDKEKQIYKGLVPDILQGLIASNQLSIKYLANSRKRSEEYMYDGSADLMMLSQAWLKRPDLLIATLPIHQHRSFLYKPEKFAEGFSLDKPHQSEVLCTRKGFSYPNLAPYIANNRLIRLDSSDHLSMMKMLFKRRCDYLVMNEFNALNLINSTFFTEQEKLYRSPKPISIVPLNIILRPELLHEKQVLDIHIKVLQESGEIDRILKRHSSH